MNRAEQRRRGATPAKPPADRRRTIIYVTIGVLAVLIIGAIGFASRTPKTASEAPVYADVKVGQTAPSFSVSTTSGPFSVPTADKKPVVLEVFATWCPHCQREVATLNKISGRYGDKVHVVAVSGSPHSMDGSGPASQADVVQFAQTFKVGYPIAYDGEMDVSKKYLQGGYPTIVVIDQNGKVAALRDGEVTEKQLTSDIDKVLKG